MQMVSVRTGRAIWLSGRAFFELDGTAYLHLGVKLSEDDDQVNGAKEIMASELEAARQHYLLRRFEETACKECGTVFRLIDKYKYPNTETKSHDYGTEACQAAARFRDLRSFAWPARVGRHL